MILALLSGIINFELKNSTDELQVNGSANKETVMKIALIICSISNILFGIFFLNQ